ncbi:hypothetical protein EU520_00785 [Candidatus Thorarchaeota archaeon]|nr:MAG: hypothetical protein EU520_00785 [Candidatus Thorarchaeota archaeon]
MDDIIFWSLLIQIPLPNEQLQSWLDTIGFIFNVLYALSIRGYFILILVGLMVFVSSLSDSLAKILVAIGVALYFVGPYLINLLAGFAGLGDITLETATQAWLALFGMNDAEMISLLLFFAEILVAVGILGGAILYFTPSSKELRSRGQSLIVRSLMLAPIIVFFHVSLWL